MLTPASEAPGWVNLWRSTDYLAGRVTGDPSRVVAPSAPCAPDGPERHLRDPWRLARVGGFTTYPAPKAHSDFWNDESGDYQVAVRDLLG